MGQTRVMAAALCVALVDGGQTVASVIYQPQHDRMFFAERGSAAFADGVRLRRIPSSSDLASLRGGVLRRFLDDRTGATVDIDAHLFGISRQVRRVRVWSTR